MSGDIDFFKGKYKREAKEAKEGKEDLTAEEIETLEAKAETDIRNRYMQDADEVARAYERSKARHQEPLHKPQEVLAATRENTNIRTGSLEILGIDIRNIVKAAEIVKFSDDRAK